MIKLLSFVFWDGCYGVLGYSYCIFGMIPVMFCDNVTVFCVLGDCHGVW